MMPVMLSFFRWTTTIFGVAVFVKLWCSCFEHPPIGETIASKKFYDEVHVRYVNWTVHFFLREFNFLVVRKILALYEAHIFRVLVCAQWMIQYDQLPVFF